jgi:hypothetical protein
MEIHARELAVVACRQAVGVKARLLPDPVGQLTGGQVPPELEKTREVFCLPLRDTRTRANCEAHG